MAFRWQADLDPVDGLRDHPLCVWAFTVEAARWKRSGHSVGRLFRQNPSHREEFVRACRRWRERHRMLAGLGRDFVFLKDNLVSEGANLFVFRSRRELRIALDELSVREIMES